MTEGAQNSAESAHVASSLGAALERCLLLLAESHGNVPGPWLDELEREFIMTIEKGQPHELSEKELKFSDTSIRTIRKIVETAKCKMSGPTGY